MKKLFVTVAAASAVLSSAYAECVAPNTPTIADDVGAISRPEMAQLFRSVKTFQAQVADYRECLVDEKKTLGPKQVTQLHNASVDTEEAVAEKFNKVFTEFKKRSQAAR